MRWKRRFAHEHLSKRSLGEWKRRRALPLYPLREIDFHFVDSLVYITGEETNEKEKNHQINSCFVLSAHDYKFPIVWRAEWVMMSHGRGAGAMMELVRLLHRVKRACLHSLSLYWHFAALKSQNMISFDEEITKEDEARESEWDARIK